MGGGNAAVAGGNRRRKKRPSYGVRTVEITKGKNGFGFTISGQAPCILSYIVPGSSAERSGLRMGDFLVAVNGQNISKAPHDDVVRFIGMSKLLKIQIAENYYSDSSDNELVTSNRHKPKFPNRLRHKQQQTRAERVVRDLQSGAIFSERAAIQLGEAALLSDRDWPDSFPNKPPLQNSYTPKTSMSPTTGLSSPPLPDRLNEGAPPQCSSPTRRCFMPPLAFPPETRLSTNPTPTRQYDESQDNLIRSRQSPVKVDRLCNKNRPKLMSIEQQFQQQEQQQHLKQNQQNILQQQHNHKQLISTIQSHPYQQCHPQALQQSQVFTSQQHQISHHSHQDQKRENILISEQNSLAHNSSQQQTFQSQHLPPQHHLLQQHPHQLLDNEQFQQKQHLIEQQYHHQIMQRQHLLQKPSSNDVRIITEQEINQILYPTLAELQLQGPLNLGESLCRAVVGYLGTIEVPKDSQGGSRLTAIKNCIRRLRIEKKVHTLVLMSVFTERVMLTNPHGITLAQYPAERITFCGVYADDKKFFGLVTVHGCSSDEFSDASQDGKGNDRNEQSVSSSCHVFMVDPNMVQHTNHARRAKTFRIECTPAGDDAPLTHCKEFPETADPILHTIMSLYRSQPGFNFDNGVNNAGLADDAQMSPQHSNTSSNSSNSDSGIGFRDDGGSHLYRHVDRVFVVEVDDNQRMRIQNYHLVGNNNNNDSNRANNINISTNSNFRTTNHLDNMRANLDNLRSNNNNYSLPVASGNVNGSIGNNILLGESSNVVNRSVNSNTNPRTNSAERNPSSSSIVNFRAMNTSDRIRANKCDSKCANGMLDNSNAIISNANYRASAKDNSCDRDSLVVNCALEDDDAEYDLLTSHLENSNMTDYLKAGLCESNNKRRQRSESRAGTSGGIQLDGRSSITDELRAALLMTARGENRSCLSSAIDGRTSVTEEKRFTLAGNRTPATECSSPTDAQRLTVRAMPDPIGIDKSIIIPATPPLPSTPPEAEGTLKHSMCRYLENKKSLLKYNRSKKLSRKDSDSDGTQSLCMNDDIHPLSVRAFSPANVKKKPVTPRPSVVTSQNSLELELSLKLSPKVYGLPVACLTSSLRPSVPSERSFSRSLEDLRDSSTSDSMVGSIGAQGGSFRDGSESDQGLDRIRQYPLPSRLPLTRYLHASETNLSNYNAPQATVPVNNYHHDVQRGAFRAVPPRAPPRPPTDLGVPQLQVAKPSSIAATEQVHNGIGRMSVSGRNSTTRLNTLGIKSLNVSPIHITSNNLMGPPTSTTALKASGLKDGRNHTRNQSDSLRMMYGTDHHGSHRDLHYERNMTSCTNYNSEHCGAYNKLMCADDGQDLVNFSSKVASVMSASNPANGVYHLNGNDKEEEYTLESDLDEQVN